MPTNIQTGTLLAQTLDGIDGPTNTNIIYGDANKLKGNSVGGADTITGGDDGAINYIYGDAYSMEGKSKGGADYLIGGANGSTNYIFGDAYSMKGKVVGGNDLLVGVNGSKNFIYGDAYIMRDGAKGGGDEFHIEDGTIISLPSILSRSDGGGEISKSQSSEFSIKGNSFIGDASIISNSDAGNDKINLGNEIQIIIDKVESQSLFNSISSAKSTLNCNISSNILIGDADEMKNSKSGDDMITAGDSVILKNIELISFSFLSYDAIAKSEMNYFLKYNILVGDANTMIHSEGGSDVIKIGNENYYIIDRVASRASSSQTSISSAQIFYSISDNFIAGDAKNLLYSIGGDDAIYVGNNIVFDVGSITSLSTISRSATSSVSVEFSFSGNNLLGDASLMKHSQGGDDVINVCNNFTSNVGQVTANGVGAKSSYVLNFTLSDNNLYGDAETMIHSKGGDDTLSIGVGIVGDSPFTLNVFNNTLYGDAKTMQKSSGGNDILTGADGKGSITYLYGDAQFTDGKSKAGDDKLISGQGNDQMWGDFGSVVSPVVASNDDDEDDEDDDHESEHDDDGDDDHCSSNINKYAGKDTFVFAANNGKDTIFDFQHGLDKIDLSALGSIHGLNDLIFAPSTTQPLDSVIDLGDGNSITLVGVNNLEATDFVFA